jgi:hypothetical protein
MKSFLRPLIARISSPSFVVFDIETFVDLDTSGLVNYAIGFGYFDNNSRYVFKYFYIADYAMDSDLFYADVFKFIFNSKFKLFYAHNFSKFDSKFILDGLKSLDYVDDLIIQPW